jgi:1-deoxy-D-xylulose-5-phosphate reductoisomerase
MDERIPLVIHGSTGSIGTQTLDVVKRLQGKRDFRVYGLACNGNIELLEKQIIEFKPDVAVVVDENKAEQLKQKLDGRSIRTEVLAGEKEAINLCDSISNGYVVIATAGFAGLAPTLAAIEAGNTVPIANKEAFLTAGRLITDSAKKHNVEILPIDSEPNAIWQTLEPEIYPDSEARHSAVWHMQRGAKHNVDSFILTCSGGPFREWDSEALKKATLQQALRHPNWDMGKLITIRSATLMNKGMEVIEIASIFGVPVDKVKIVVHPQSIIHSGVEFIDGSQKVQQGPHDMRYPIAYSLTFPDRIDTGLKRLELASVGRFDFEEPDMERFPSIGLAYRAGRLGGTAPAVLNGADETAVELFSEGRIGFTQMPELIRSALDAHVVKQNPTLAEIITADSWARDYVRKEFNESVSAKTKDTNAGRKLRR